MSLLTGSMSKVGNIRVFDLRSNLDLEKALGRQAADVRISAQGQTYQVTLPEGPAVSTTGGNQMNIRRIDKPQRYLLNCVIYQ